MPPLSDRSFSPKAYARMALVAVGFLTLLGLVVAAHYLYQDQVEDPRMLRKRFDDPPGQSGLSSARVSAMGARAVPTLLADVAGTDSDKRGKALELLGTIDDPRVIPALAELLNDADVSKKLAGLGALAHTGKPEAAQKIWPLTESADEILRFRALVGIGLCGAEPDLAKLAERLATAGDSERYVLAWAHGHLQRRLASIAAGHKGYVSPAKAPEDDAEVNRLQEEVDAALRAIDSRTDVPAATKKLAELTDVNFATWNFGHQIALQLLALGGPRQFRGMKMPEVQPRGASGVHLQGGGRARNQVP